MCAAAAQKLRLKQGPIDVWSTREKLALACAVLRSGDQNWYSVSRSLKPFGELKRPQDWFSQKNCALQYSELLENVETPKRKRGERGENTAQDLIVLELQQKRIDELQELIKEEKDVNSKLKTEIDAIKGGQANEDLMKEIWHRMQQEEQDKETQEEEHKKWLVEREAKMAQLKANRHHLLAARSPKSKQAQQPPPPANETETIKLEVQPEVKKPRPPDSLTIKIENSTEPLELNEQPQQADKQKVIPSPNVSAPSTSPLLTSLLQSPSPSASSSSPYCSNMLSPVAIRDMQQRISLSPSHSQIYNQATSPIRPNQPLTPTSSSLPGDSFVEPPPPSCKDSENTCRPGDTSPPMSVSSPTLSKLLESASSNLKQSVNAYDISLNEALEKKLLEASTEDQNGPNASQEIDATSSEKEANDALISAIPEMVEEIHKRLQATEGQVQEANEKELTTQMLRENIPIEVKQEKIEMKDTSEENSIDEDIKIKHEIRPELEDLTQTTTSESKSDTAAPSTPGRPKRKRPTTPGTPTPAATRRSGRVRAIKDRKNSSEEEPSSQALSQSPSQPPPAPEATLGAKKATLISVGAAEVPPMSEESSDNTVISVGMSGPSTPAAVSKPKTSTALSTSDSVPNSPTPTSIAGGDDLESQKGYKVWKKSILLLWRQAATHKFSTLFHHPVTDSEAKGYSTVVYRPMDLMTIRKKIETGQIKTTAEFQRDMMLMFQNAIMYNNPDHDVHQMAVEMEKEILEGIEDFIETQQKSNNVSDSSIPASKPRGRRSNVSTSSAETHEPDQPSLLSTINRRKRISTDVETKAELPPIKAKVKKTSEPQRQRRANE